MSPASHYASAFGNQVEDQDHHSHNQQKVDQAAADMKAESQKPHNQKNHENCPKHICLSLRAS